VARAINREDLVERGLFGLADVAVGPIAPAFAWAYGTPDPAASPQAFDLAAAQGLAETAGIAGAQPTIMATVDNPRPAEVIRTQLVDIGLDVQLESLQQAAWNERWQAKDFDWIINGSVVDADPDDGFWNFFHTEGPWNTYSYSNPEVDELLDLTRVTANQNERAEQFQSIQEILQEDVAFVFLYHTFDITGFYNKVQGYLPIPEMRYLETVWLEQ
jgi:peptide/nickel transport system substrate-binding protein